MKRKILIVDGSNLLFQMFFGMPSRIYNEQGIGIWGVLGFVGALLKIIRQINPTHLTVLFDGGHVGIVLCAAGGEAGEHQHNCQKHCNNLFHNGCSFLFPPGRLSSALAR